MFQSLKYNTVLRRNTNTPHTKKVTQYTIFIMYMSKSCHIQSRSYYRVSLLRPTFKTTFDRSHGWS